MPLPGDVQDIEWQDLATCEGVDTNYFFDEYESNLQVRNIIDEMCLSCPVFAQCLGSATENGEWGVWGGIYLVSGKPDTARNAHKTPETWNRIRSRIDS